MKTGVLFKNKRIYMDLYRRFKDIYGRICIDPILFF